MGMYTGIRFKGIVKKQFRPNFRPIAIDGKWSESSDLVFANFGNYDRSSFIPCGYLCYMPKSWDKGFERSWNEQTGEWTFKCSLKNYGNEIEAWLEIIPYFISSISHLEYLYEEWDRSRLYKLVNGKLEIKQQEVWELESY